MDIRAYYNEIDPQAAQWLRELIEQGHIAPGDVDERSIEDVEPAALSSYTQCHFFAGIGVWSYALRRAGWPDDRPVWTGSCPCFPAGTLILTETGLVPIEEVRAGDKVVSHTGKLREVIRVGSAPNRPVVSVKGQGLHELRCTPNHPVLAAKRRTDYKRSSPTYGKIVLAQGDWMPESNLCGSSWALPVNFAEHLPVPQFPAKEWVGRDPNLPGETGVSFAEMCGRWLGDGWCNGEQVCICDNKGKDEVGHILDSVGIAWSTYEQPTARRYVVSSKLLAMWLTRSFGSGCRGKRIPLWVHCQSPEWRQAFLKGYAGADGHRGMQPRGGGSIEAVTTVNKGLAISVRVLWNQEGRSASVTQHHSSGSVFQGRRIAGGSFYRVTAYQTSRSFKFCQGYGFGAVRSVSEVQSHETVYNMEVQHDHTYIADGIVVHNCQPFSSAGQRKGFADERHLWPAFHWLILQLRPHTVFGEQVAGKAGETWLDLVSADLEVEGYAFGAAVTAACGFGAPHQRKRLYWVADARSERHDGIHPLLHEGAGRERRAHEVLEVAGSSKAGSVADPGSPGLPTRERQELSGANRDDEGRAVEQRSGALDEELPGPTNGFWRDADWLGCRDGKWRPVEPGTFPLVDGAAARVGRLRGYGNAVVSPQAQAFIEAFMESQS